MFYCSIHIALHAWARSAETVPRRTKAAVLEHVAVGATGDARDCEGPGNWTQSKHPTGWQGSAPLPPAIAYAMRSPLGLRLG
ncbi:hypothetical protein NDU88_005398 [Pleurodeles waltl]|uniref:Secreted protein n=1 Tax=Pleurodeles waltl TaxID=8319 RepID=A0AAV7LCC7_PLEWA|nr:hypothetical protein NDU88_005398 [Pleurodeles waltl]